jgi:hypothetical protein
MTKIGSRTVSLRLCEHKSWHVPYFLPLSRAAGRDGATRRDHPSQGHGSSPAALHQMPRCTADECTSIVPGQFSFGPDFDAELPAVPAPQRVMLHPHQLHISTSRELLAYPWWSCASTRTVKPQESNQKPRDRADSPHCVCRHSATVCMHLWAGIVSMSGSVAASQAPGL